MRFDHTIEACDNAEDPIWYVVIQGDQPDDYDGTGADYGREVLRNWIDDEQVDKVTDEYGNPHLRVLVHFEDAETRSSHDAVATITSDDLAEPSPEIAAVEAARDAKLYARRLDLIADARLEEALTQARAAGHGANALARLVDGAVSRPVALRMMR
ncbi:hypothetical protein [Streptomyces sp. NPDC020983]|uniref:hypothetical protein n=1 Tax=Streptomyces sp. NPDC020983 TaxID=3365106 RepID=UPI0037974737